MTTKINLILAIFFFLTFNICFATSYQREYKLNDRVTIFSDDDGKSWGAMFDGTIIIQPSYAGIDLLGEHYLKLMQYNEATKRISYGASDLNGTVQLACEYEFIAIMQGRLQAFKPPVILEAKFSSTQSASLVPKETEVKHASTKNSFSDFENSQNIIDDLEKKPEPRKIDLSLIRAKIESNNEPKTDADKMPSFPGGEEKMQQFIKDNLEFPEEAKVQGIQGRVVVRFVVMPNGNAESVEILHGLEANCDKEAVRIIELMPRWNPGMQNGKKVPVYFTLPISFFF